MRYNGPVPAQPMTAPPAVKILVAPNALKGSLTAAEAAGAMADGARQALPDAEIDACPVADGGDGFAAVVAAALGAEPVTSTVTGPLGQPVNATWHYSATTGTALIEMAAAAGLALLDETQRDPLRATSRGVGELLRAALDAGARHIVLGIGGSATTDGGMGMAAALGAVFRDGEGRPLDGNGAELDAIASIDPEGLDPRLKDVHIDIASDVDNPLLGEHGAARIYAPQKGATPTQVETLEAGLTHYAEHLEKIHGGPLRDIPGAGAAGGLGAGAMAFLGADLKPGAEVVLDLLDFDARLEGVQLVLTAEGRLDAQTSHGKAPAAVAKRARAHGIPCIVIAGSLAADADTLEACGITAAFALCNGPMTRDEAMNRARALLTAATRHVIATFAAGRGRTS